MELLVVVTKKIYSNTSNNVSLYIHKSGLLLYFVILLNANTNRYVVIQIVERKKGKFFIDIFCLIGYHNNIEICSHAPVVISLFPLSLRYTGAFFYFHFFLKQNHTLYVLNTYKSSLV